MSKLQLLDTNAIIYLLNGRLASPLPEGEYSVSVITEIELLSFPGLSNEEEQRIRDLMLSLERIQLSDTVRDLAIRLRRANRLKLPDAIIAASAILQEAAMLTNDQVFASIDGLECRALQLI